MSTDARSASASVSGPTGGALWPPVEVLFIFLLFFLFAGSPPPDVGEAHYLAKAKHYWNPAWGQGDMFLESKDAHGVFYWTFGWVTRFVSLPAAAWIGRCVSWLLLAWSWQRLSAAVAPLRLMSILTAGLMLLFIRWFHMAGEWIVGGVEAKSFSYALVFLALESVARGRWRLAFLLAGGATALHVLVGGWTGVAIAIAWLLVGREQITPFRLALSLLVAAALAAIGVAPALALSQGVDPETASHANRIYVFERLSHHLVFHRFPPLYIARHALVAVIWGILAWRISRAESSGRRLHAAVLGALAIGIAGIVIDQGLVVLAGVQGLTKEEYQAVAAPLLKFYWFRLSDATLAIGAALAVGRILVSSMAAGSAVGTWGIMLAMLAAGANLAEIGYQRSQQRLPGSFLQPKPTSLMQGRGEDSRAAGEMFSELSAAEQLRFWKDACRWAAENTSPSAKFLTPRRQQTFKWYAGRSEVVSWKDVPQDAESLVAWSATLAEVFPKGSGETGLAFHSDGELIRLARKYGAEYIVIDRTRSQRPIGLPRLYPDATRDNPAYAIYRVPPGSAP